MKVIYWRWKDCKTISKSYIQKDLGNMLELNDCDGRETSYPLRVLKKEIDIIRIGPIKKSKKTNPTPPNLKEQEE